MPKLVEIQLGEFRPVGLFQLEEIACGREDYVILDIDRGVEFGRILSDPTTSCKGKVETALGKVVRVATQQDLMQIETHRRKAQEALRECVKKVEESKIEMRVTRAEYAFDGSKVIFYFTAEGRVDFRNLVKDLARIFKIRIELKQIGVRDKAKIVGGFGICGRELCCSSYMKFFHPVSMKMPKDQNLPLNPNRISGVCGRIKCCMAYEFQVYREYARGLPKVGDKVTTPQGKGKVIDANILKRYITVDLGEGKMTKVSFEKKYEL